MLYLDSMFSQNVLGYGVVTYLSGKVKTVVGTVNISGAGNDDAVGVKIVKVCARDNLRSFYKSYVQAEMQDSKKASAIIDKLEKFVGLSIA
jgi:hypothetical protein